MTASLQPQTRFALRLSESRPLIPLEAAVFTEQLAGFDQDDILNLINRGDLRFAFNIASKEARRMEVRIFYRSILEFGVEQKVAKEREELTRVIDEILPPLGIINSQLSTIRSSVLSQRFACERMHPLNLIAENSLTATSQPRGPKESPLITRSSVVEFLQRRRIP